MDSNEVSPLPLYHLIIDKIKSYSELIMISHTLFSLPFALMAMIWAANGLPNGKLIFWILIALFAARNGANAFNRYADAIIDGENPRTADRHIPKKIIKRQSALIFAVVFFILFEIAAYNINMLCLILSPFAIILFIFYSYTKRFSWLCHIILGIACGGAPVGAWLAVSGTLSVTPFILGGAVTFFIAGFDILYATSDMDFDKKFGLFSIPVRFGLKKSKVISAAFHIFFIMILLSMYYIIPTGKIYLIGVSICAILLIVEHIIVIPDNQKIMKWVSYHINQIVSVTFFIFAATDFLNRM